MATKDIYSKGICLILIMASIAMIVLGSAIVILYETGFQEERQRLIETAQSHARFLEAVARFDKKNTEQGAFEATLSQIKEAHGNFKGFGETGEFTLAKREGNQIVFLLSHRHHDLETPHPVPFDGREAEPMQLALQGKSGSVIGLDYRGESVLAAYEPVAELNLGVVAKIDMKEIRAPFIRAAWSSVAIALFFVFVGTRLFLRITNPIQAEIQDKNERLVTRNRELKNALATIKTISGIVPLCAWCGNRIKDDNGEWVKIDKYIDGHTDAHISHGMCPECHQAFTESAKPINKARY